MTARSDWEKHKNYPPDWSWATSLERVEIVIAWIAAGITGVGMFVGVLLVIGATLDGISRLSGEHERCLKHATNGYEIERCR